MTIDDNDSGIKFRNLMRITHMYNHVRSLPMKLLSMCTGCARGLQVHPLLLSSGAHEWSRYWESKFNSKRSFDDNLKQQLIMSSSLLTTHNDPLLSSGLHLTKPWFYRNMFRQLRQIHKPLNYTLSVCLWNK